MLMRSYSLRKGISCCHPERSEGSAFAETLSKKQVPRRLMLLGMTPIEMFPQTVLGIGRGQAALLAVIAHFCLHVRAQAQI